MPCRFVREGVDGASYLAVAPRLLVACFFWLIVAMVIFPFVSGAFDARTFCRLTFVIIIAIAIALDVAALSIAIAVRVAPCVQACALPDMCNVCPHACKSSRGACSST